MGKLTLVNVGLLMSKLALVNHLGLLVGELASVNHLGLLMGKLALVNVRLKKRLTLVIVSLGNVVTLIYTDHPSWLT